MVNGTNFKVSNNSGSDITLKTTQTLGDGSDSDLPYLGVNTLGNGSFTGNYGDGIVVNYDLTTNFTGFGLYQFLIHLQPGPNVQSPTIKRAAGLYLGTSAARTFFANAGANFPSDLEWHWRFIGSSYYPGAYFRFLFPENYNPYRASGIPQLPFITTSGSTYSYEFHLDDIIRVTFPELANSATRILGIELSVVPVAVLVDISTGYYV
jgi:hypothetical protein